MLVSTRGRYALRVMIDLAEHQTGVFVPLDDVAKRQEISEKYLEGILAGLSKAGMVIAARGKGGGYQLAREPKNYTVDTILKLAEGSLAPVSCLEQEENTCPRAAECRTLPLWHELDQVITNYLAGVTLADLMQKKEQADRRTLAVELL